MTQVSTSMTRSDSSASGTKSAGVRRPRVGMLPSHERLDADDVTRAQVDLRLIEHAQLVASQCVVQLAAPGEMHLCQFVRAGVVQPGAVASGVLGAVHRGVRVAQQLARMRAVVGEHRDSCARGHEQLVPVHNERPADRRQQLLGEDAERLALPNARQQDGEVVGAHARDGVSLADRSRATVRRPASSSSLPTACPRLAFTFWNASRSSISTASFSRAAALAARPGSRGLRRAAGSEDRSTGRESPGGGSG